MLTGKVILHILIPAMASHADGLFARSLQPGTVFQSPMRIIGGHV
jgi:hypothetical protein